MIDIYNGTGSGFFVEPNLVMTACHVVDGEKSIKVSKQGYLNWYVGTVQACDKDLDIAFVKLSQKVPGVTHTIFATASPKTGRQTYGGGYPFGLPLIITEGNWQRETPFGDGAIMDSTHMLPGDSGSPLVIWQDGEVRVVGIRTAVLRVGEKDDKVLFPNIGFVRPPHMIQEFLHENL